MIKIFKVAFIAGLQTSQSMYVHVRVKSVILRIPMFIEDKAKYGSEILTPPLQPQSGQVLLGLYTF